ncbi:MAG TPA: hypothetical protein VIT45_11960 [Allosphingosinicella sp.]
MIRPLLSIALLAASAGCGSIPADPDGTLERVRAEGRYRVGLIASSNRPLAPERAQALLRRLSVATGARASIEPGPAEPLLARLEEGELDLVVGEFAEPSPWASKVTITEPIAANGPTALAAAARNGENAWIALLFREARTVAE